MLNVKVDTAKGDVASQSDSAPRQFALSGPLPNYDERVTPLRGDLADLALAGTFFAPHYVEPQLRFGAAVRTMIRSAGSSDARAVSELLLGEGFAVLDTTGGWCWGYSVQDRYCGYVPVEALSDAANADPAPTHIVHRRAALGFAEPSIKAPMVAEWPMGARIVVSGISECGGFLETSHGYVSQRHLTSLDDLGHDPVSTATQMIGAPYLWGGRSGAGLDCSGLVQLALLLAGVAAPRDSDQQMAALGRLLGEDEALHRGDLVFFPGHVGIMANDRDLTHANAHWMQVITEPLSDVIARFPPDGDPPVLARKRLD